MNGEFLHLSSFAESYLGKSIPLSASLNRKADGTQRPLLFVGGVHGDEPEGVELAQQLLNWLLKNNNKVVHNWILIPCLNVDGYSAHQRTNGRGVDLNRNFPASDWSPNYKAERYFPGSAPGSEPEVRALIEIITATKPAAIVHFHSWEPCVVYTGGKGESLARVLGEGTPYPVREDIGYPTPGSLGDYGWKSHGIPVVCIEAQEKSDLTTVWPIFRDGLINALCTKQWLSNV